MASAYNEPKSWRTSVFTKREFPESPNKLEEVLSREQIRFLDDEGISHVYVIIEEYSKPPQKNSAESRGTITKKLDEEARGRSYGAIIYNYSEKYPDKPEYRVEKISASREEAINMAYADFNSLVKSQMAENSRNNVQRLFKFFSSYLPAHSKIF